MPLLAVTDSWWFLCPSAIIRRGHRSFHICYLHHLPCKLVFKLLRLPVEVWQNSKFESQKCREGSHFRILFYFSAISIDRDWFSSHEKNGKDGIRGLWFRFFFSCSIFRTFLPTNFFSPAAVIIIMPGNLTSCKSSLKLTSISITPTTWRRSRLQEKYPRSIPLNQAA